MKDCGIYFGIYFQNCESFSKNCIAFLVMYLLILLIRPFLMPVSKNRTLDSPGQSQKINVVSRCHESSWKIVSSLLFKRWMNYKNL